MKTYRITTPVERAQGFQTWLVKADSEEEALAIFEKGDAEFEAEEVEVSQTGPPEIREIDDQEAGK